MNAVNREFVNIENSSLGAKLARVGGITLLSPHLPLRWEKEHSVVSSFFGRGEPMVPPGSPDARGEQKH